MKKQFLSVTAAALLFPLFSAYANTEHDAFLDAEKKVKYASYQKFKEITAQLDHPLKPYVEQVYWQRHPDIEHQSEIERYLTIYENTPLEWPVRKAWLQRLQKQNRKAAFINNYRETTNSELTCTYLQYQLDLGAPEQAIMSQVTNLWTVGKSQPEECDSLFNTWRKKGYMSQEKIWQRITLSAQGGSQSLLPYLKTLLPKNEQYLADFYRKVRSDPSAAAGMYRYKNKTVKEGEIAHYGIKRLIWRDKTLALKAWEKLDKMFNYSDEQKADVYYSFALALASSGHPEARFWLSKVPKNRQDRKLMQWQLGNMLKTQDWSGIVAFFTGKENLSLGQQYWLAYSLEQRGDNERAKVIWQTVAKERDYYGFLAAARLGLPVELNNQPLLVSDKVVADVEQAPGF